MVNNMMMNTIEQFDDGMIWLWDNTVYTVMEDKGKRKFTTIEEARWYRSLFKAGRGTQLTWDQFPGWESNIIFSETNEQ